MVRMYRREKVKLFLLATEDGIGPTAAAEFAGVTVSAAKKWATGHLPRSYTGGGCRIVARKPPRREASLGPDKSILDWLHWCRQFREGRRRREGRI